MAKTHCVHKNMLCVRSDPEQIQHDSPSHGHTFPHCLNYARRMPVSGWFPRLGTPGVSEICSTWAVWDSRLKGPRHRQVRFVRHNRDRG